MNFDSGDKYAKMKRAFARLERIYTDTGNSITTSDAQDATEDFVNHAYHLKDFLKKDFPQVGSRVEAYITRSRPLALIADLQNSFKHAHDVQKRRSEHESTTGAQPIGDLVRINTHTRMDLVANAFVCSQSLQITYCNVKVDALNLASDSIDAWDDFLRTESITLPHP